MEKIINLDAQGRIYIPEEMRRLFEEKAFVVQASEEGICLKPVHEDPLIELEKISRGKLKKTISQLKKEAREEIEKYASKKIR